MDEWQGGGPVKQNWPWTRRGEEEAAELMESWLAFVRAVAEVVRVAACAARPKSHSTSLNPATGGMRSAALGVRSVEDR